ncbi:MAG TPA: tetratricopeptide repeat protein [Pirellulales bacterium]
MAGGALLVLVLVSYAPVVRDTFIWDDDAYVTQNTALHSLNGLWRIWFVPFTLPQYYPLVHSTFWIEYHLWGLKPAGYHVVNVLLHASSVLLLWRLLVRLRVPGAWLGAALFAVHPVHVESVAWITERKNVLSLPLALAALLCYLRYSPADEDIAERVSAESGTLPRSGRLLWYAAALLCFVAALLSKTIVASVPAVLLVIYWWKRGRIGLRDVLPLAPFFVIGAAAGLYTAWLEKYDVGAAGAEWDFSPADRVLIAGRVAWFYAAKLFWPKPLMFFYPRWTIDDHAVWQYLFPLTAFALVIGLWMARKRVGRGPLAAVLIFGGVLVPVLGFFNVYPFRFSFVADHFQYHASIALIALVAAGAAWGMRQIADDSQGLARCIAGAVLVLLAVSTVRRVMIFHDPESLYRDTLAKNPESVVSLANLALFLADQGRTEEALPLAREGVRLGPNEAAAQNNLGMVLLRAGDRDGFKPGQLEEAVEHIEECLRLNPKYLTAHSNMAYTLLTHDDVEGAAKHFQQVLELSPANARALYGTGVCLERQGKNDQATDYFQRSVDSDPDLAQPRYDLARLRLADGRLDDAIEQLQQALRVDGGNADGHFLLASALVRRGDLAGAAQHFNTVVKLRPNHVAALVNLGIVLLNLHQNDQALVCLEEALRQQPDSVNAHYGMATALAQIGQPAAAVDQLRIVLQLDPQHAEGHFDLGNLLFQQGNSQGAVAEYSAAVRLRPTYVDALMNLAKAELKLGDIAAAAKHLAEANRLQPENRQIRELLGQIGGAPAPVPGK